MYAPKNTEHFRAYMDLGNQDSAHGAVVVINVGLAQARPNYFLNRQHIYKSNKMLIAQILSYMYIQIHKTHRHQLQMNHIE